jgi:hypothetical protein
MLINNFLKNLIKKLFYLVKNKKEEKREIYDFTILLAVVVSGIHLGIVKIACLKVLS